MEFNCNGHLPNQRMVGKCVMSPRVYFERKMPLEWENDKIQAQKHLWHQQNPNWMFTSKGNLEPSCSSLWIYCFVSLVIQKLSYRLSGKYLFGFFFSVNFVFFFFSKQTLQSVMMISLLWTYSLVFYCNVALEMFVSTVELKHFASDILTNFHKC